MTTVHDAEVRSMLLEDGNLHEMVARLRARKRKTAPLEEIWAAFASVYSDLPAGRERRLWLWTVLKELDGAGEITLPVRAGKQWERASDIPLPTKIRLASGGSTSESLDWRTFPWHPALQWVLERRFISAQHVEFLTRVNRGIVEGWFAEPEPLKNRSLQLTGDEKLLQKFAKTKLFGPGKLNLAMLGCEREVLPIAFERISISPVMLMFENAAPFMLARRVARETLASGTVPEFGTIAYGGGKQVLKSAEYLPTIEPKVESVLYVGDLDAEGLEIAGELKERSKAVPVRPATAFHAAMLDSAAELDAPDGWPAKDGQSRAIGRRASEFPDSSIRDACMRIVQMGKRIPEEVLSTRWIRRLLSET